MKNIRQLFLLFLLGLSSLAAYAERDCSIVRGNDWAFLIRPPENWASVCNMKDEPVPASFLWPEGTKLREAIDSAGFIYINVSKKSDIVLDQKIKTWIANVKKESTRVRVEKLEPIPYGNKKFAPIWLFKNVSGNYREMIAFAESETTFVTFIMASRNPDFFKLSKEAFDGLVFSFTPLHPEAGLVTPETPDAVTEGQISDYQSITELACKRAGRRNNDSVEHVDSYCTCMMTTFKENVSKSDWQRAFYLGSKKQIQDELNIFSIYKDKLSECRENAPAP